MNLETSGRRNGAERIAYVLKYVVLQFGASVGVGMYLYAAYETDTWGSPREFVHLLLFWMAAGIVFGIAQLNHDERRELRRPERQHRGAA